MENTNRGFSKSFLTDKEDGRKSEVVHREKHRLWAYFYQIFSQWKWGTPFINQSVHNHAKTPWFTPEGSKGAKSRRSNWYGWRVGRRWCGIRCACLPDKTPADKWSLVSFPLASPLHLDHTCTLLSTYHTQVYNGICELGKGFVRLVVTGQVCFFRNQLSEREVKNINWFVCVHLNV